MDDGVYTVCLALPAWLSRSECMCTFHCSAVQKIITDGAPSSRDFPAAAVGGEEWKRCASENEEGGNRDTEGGVRKRTTGLNKSSECLSVLKNGARRQAQGSAVSVSLMGSLSRSTR